MPWAKKGHRRCPFRWRNRRELVFDLHGYRYTFSETGEAAPVKNIVVSGGDAMAPFRDSLFFFLAHSLPLPPSREPPKLSSSFRGTPRQRSCAKPAPRGAIVQIFRLFMPPTKKRTPSVSFSLAEKERFELSRRVLWQPTPLAGAPLRPLEYFSIHRRVGLLV